MGFEMIIEDVFEVKGKGMVLTGRIKGLNDTTDEKEAELELSRYIKKGDNIKIDDEILTVKDLHRNGKLMSPVIYGNTVSLLVDSLEKDRNAYFHKKIVNL